MLTLMKTAIPGNYPDSIYVDFHTYKGVGKTYQFGLEKGRGLNTPLTSALGISTCDNSTPQGRSLEFRVEVH